jgi:hypothetical protein
MNGSSHPKNEKRYTGDFFEHFPIQGLLGEIPIRETGN